MNLSLPQACDHGEVYTSRKDPERQSQAAERELEQIAGTISDDLVLLNGMVQLSLAIRFRVAGKLCLYESHKIHVVFQSRLLKDCSSSE